MLVFVLFGSATCASPRCIENASAEGRAISEKMARRRRIIGRVLLVFMACVPPALLLMSMADRNSLDGSREPPGDLWGLAQKLEKTDYSPYKTYGANQDWAQSHEPIKQLHG